jgi:hypothetical protein
MEGRIGRSGDLPDVILVAIAAPVVRSPFSPAIPDRLVRSLVIGLTWHEALLVPDEGVAPVASLLGEDS